MYCIVNLKAVSSLLHWLLWGQLLYAMQFTLDFVKWSGEHDDPPDVAKCEVTKAISTMRKCACEEPLTPVQQIYNTEAATLTSRDRS